MLCCTAAAIAATSVLATSSKRPTNATLALVATAVGATALVIAAHAHHYVERAEMNGRSLLAEIAAQPICTGTPRLRLATRQPNGP